MNTTHTDRALLDPEAKCKHGYDCFVIARAFLRQIVIEIESSGYFFRKMDCHTFPYIVEGAIRNNLETILNVPVGKRNDDFYRDLAYITGVPFIAKTEHDMESYIRLLRNIFLRGVELGLITVEHQRGVFKFINTFNISYYVKHPRRVRSNASTLVEKAHEFHLEHPGVNLPIGFYEDEVRLRHIHPYLSDEVFKLKFEEA